MKERFSTRSDSPALTGRFRTWPVAFFAGHMLAILALTAPSPTVQAATLYWDGGSVDIAGDGNNGSAGGAGIWDNTIKNWDAGVSPHVAWTSADAPSFGGTAATVTLGANVTVGGIININSGSASNPYIIAGGSGPYALTLPAAANLGGGGYGVISADLAGGTTSLTKAGSSSTYVLSGATAFGAGTTAISGGVLQIAGSAALGTGNLSLTGGGVLGLGNGNFTRSLGTGGNAFQMSGAGGGFAAYGANRNVSIGTATWGSTVGTRIVGTLTLGAADADATVTWTGNISFGGSPRTVQVGDGSAATDAIISGQLLNNPGGLTKTGAGTLSLTAANNYYGVTTVSGGVLKLDNAGALPGGVGTTSGNCSGLTLSGGVVGLTASSGNFSRSKGTETNQVQWTGSGGFAAYGGDRIVSSFGTCQWNAGSFVPAGSALILGAADADSTVIWQSSFNLAGSTRTIIVNDGPAVVDARITGQIGVAGGANGQFIKDGAGKLQLTANNIYVASSAVTTISAGILELGNNGTSGSLSAITKSISVSSGATLSVNRNNAFTQATDLNGQLIVGEGGFAQVGSGTTTLSLANTYTGDTTVSAGTLTLADGGQLKFVIGANGVNNQVNGSGTVNLDGAFNLDVSGANTTTGNSWALVDVANLTETFGATFSVTSTAGAFTETSPGVWKLQIDGTKRYVFAEATGTLSVQANNAPVAQAVSMGATAGVLTPLQIIGGKFPPTDADNDTVTLQSVSYTSGNGATVAVNGNNVEYTAASGFSGTDTFDYTVSDGFGGTDTKTVTVTVTSANAASLNVVYGPTVVGSDFVVRFAGIPGTTYTVETNGTVDGPGWVKYGNYTAPTTEDSHPYGVGIFQVTKPNEGEPSLYFRSIHPSY